MKYSGKIKKFGLILFAAAALLIAGCDNSGGDTAGGSGNINLDELSFLLFEDYGDNADPYSIDVILFSSSADWGGVESTGTGTVVYLPMFSGSNDPIAVGTYSFSVNENSGTFSDEGFILIISESVFEFYLITGGTVSISISAGPVYTISGNLDISLFDLETFEEIPSGSVSFSFTGPATEIGE